MGWAEQASSKVRRAFYSAFNQVGRTAVADIKQLISVRVQYQLPGRFGGKTWSTQRGFMRGTGRHTIGSPDVEIIRSEAGESPRREYGNLYESIKYKIEDIGAALILNIYTDNKAAISLEHGFIHFRSGEFVDARPFWSPSRKKIQGYMISMIKRIIKQRLGSTHGLKIISISGEGIIIDLPGGVSAPSPDWRLSEMQPEDFYE